MAVIVRVTPLSLRKRRNGTKLVKNLAKCRRRLRGSFGQLPPTELTSRPVKYSVLKVERLSAGGLPPAAQSFYTRKTKYDTLLYLCMKCPSQPQILSPACISRCKVSLGIEDCPKELSISIYGMLLAAPNPLAGLYFAAAKSAQERRIVQRNLSYM